MNLALKEMARRSAVALLLTSMALGQVEDVLCTDVAPCPENFELQLFDPAMGVDRFLTVEGPRVPGHLNFDVGMLLGYQYKPLVIFVQESGASSEEEFGLIRSQVSMRLMGTIGLFDRYHVGLDIPLMLGQSGEYFALPAGNGTGKAGLGDPRLHLKAWLVDYKGVGIAFAPIITIPASGGKGFRGGDQVSVRPRVLAGYELGPVQVGANLGYLIRKKTRVLASDVDDQLLYGIAAAYEVIPRLRVLGEIFGRLGFSNKQNEAPAEADLAAEFEVIDDLKVGLGLGFGLIQGLGQPSVRSFLHAHWTPSRSDADGDGVRDRRDRCPKEREDRDGFQDSDGCPDPDNDEDLILDVVDQCPNEPEDRDGFEDEDGCPDLDNDQDGIADLDDECPRKAGPAESQGCPPGETDQDRDGVIDRLDRCPEDPEDVDMFEDDDGCPDPDNDGDGIPDGFDDCPLDPEDIDDYQDDDGCPDLDDDQDGVPDTCDRCSDEKETINGVRDWDGCPDLGDPAAEPIEGGIALHKPIRFKGRTAKIRPVSQGVLAQVALIMLANPESGILRIEVHTDNEGGAEPNKELSQKRAEAVRDFLVQYNVKPERIKPVGMGQDKPLADNTTKKGRATNQRVELYLDANAPE